MKRARELRVLAGDERDLRRELAIPRPRRRRDCAGKARPCPWVGCKWHTAIETPPPSSRGRATRIQSRAVRASIAPSTDAREVEQFVSDVAEVLPQLEATCVLDVADAGRTGPTAIARLLGVPKQQVVEDLRRALDKLEAHPGLAALLEARRG